MLTDLLIEIAGLEAGYLDHLHEVNELDRIEGVFDRIIRELDQINAKLKPTNKSK